MASSSALGVDKTTRAPSDRQSGVNAAIGIAGELGKSLRLDDLGTILRSSDRRRRRSNASSYIRTVSAKAFQSMKYDENYVPKSNCAPSSKFEVPERMSQGVKYTPSEVCMNEDKKTWFQTIKKVVLLNKYDADPAPGQKRGYQFPVPLGDIQITICYTPRHKLLTKQNKQLYDQGGYVLLPDPDVADLNDIIRDNLQHNLVDEDESGSQDDTSFSNSTISSGRTKSPVKIVSRAKRARVE